jgi:hypothetical protein
VPVEAIEQRAVKADPRRALLKALLLIPFVLGWLAHKAVLTVSYTWSAVVAGWQEAGRLQKPEGGSDE